MKQLILFAAACLPLAAQALDPAADLVNQAYRSLRTGDLVGAVAYLRDARTLAPERASVSKELGYAYLKMQDGEAAREAFEEALRLAPDDAATALQLGFLERQAGREPEARRLFEQVVNTGSSEAAETARRALAQDPADPVYSALERAYEARKQGALDEAVALFRQASELDQTRADIRKELGYTLLQTGETQQARDVFAEAVRLDPSDERLLHELSYLRYETGQPAEALAGFQSLRASPDPAVAASADETAARLEAELGGSIGRWEQAAATEPANRSARIELGDLYQRRNEPGAAAREYAAAFALPGPNRDELLLKLGRARQAAGNLDGANGAWLLASRSEEVRIAEIARGLLPRRFPYANEFRSALALNPDQTALRKELAYLLLQVGQSEEATAEFATVVERDPNDLQAAAQLAFLYLEQGSFEQAVVLLERARSSGDPELAKSVAESLSRIGSEARQLGEKSLRESYLLDAQRQFTAAWEADPSDLSIALKLGVVHNLLRQDREALRWFRMASESPDSAVAAQALESYRNLAPQYQRATTTVWMYPFYSRRFGTVFGYGQVKTEFRIGNLPVKPYLSLRAAGNAGRVGGAEQSALSAGQQLSESSLIAAFGLRAPLSRGVTLWGEAGESFSYRATRPDGVPGAIPDYRGGLNWFRARGASLGANEPGFFQESNLDAVYLSRFNHDALAYFQYKPGYRLPNLGPLKAQLYMNWNLVADTSREYWANRWETGPGVRIRVPGVRPPMDFSVDFVRGVHLSNKGNTRRPNYFDLRAGLWYSFSR
ncbi:MAG: tetratricopeptide repeat protein [Acidobacteria bacterium]|nr:tetratricopeptide repeat protein [Acidobacteriota bacterium]